MEAVPLMLTVSLSINIHCYVKCKIHFKIRKYFYCLILRYVEDEIPHKQELLPLDHKQFSYLP